MLTVLWNLGSFIIALGILVAVHEWGHYYVAKLCKVKILRFSIGFGKPIYKRITSTGMEFVIAAIPLGGYVKMLDGRVEPLSSSELDLDFDQKPVLQRMAIVFAGPMVNFIFAVFAYVVIGLVGVQTVKPIIGEVLPNSYAAQTNLSPGDQIIAINNRNVDDWQEVNMELVRYSGEQFIPISLIDKNNVGKQVSLPINGWKIDPTKNDLFSQLGFKEFVPEATTRLAWVEKGNPADLAGLKINDEIIKIDGTPMANWRQIVGQIEARPNQVLSFAVMRENAMRTIDVRVGQHPDDPLKGYVGVLAHRQAWPEGYVFTKKLNLIDSFTVAIDDTWRLITTTLNMLGKLFTGNLSIKSLSGPVSIAQGAGAHASYGLIMFLGFLALISVNLGIINLLPLPVLDGGHLMFFTYEWITGKPVSDTAQEIGFRIGGALLFVLMATAIINDFTRHL